MTSQRRLAGTRWRFLAWGAPTERGGMYGRRIEHRSDPVEPSVFDELVVDRWLHVEQMNSGAWWMNVAGVKLDVYVDRDGRPTAVHVELEDPRDGCEYSGEVGR